MPESFTKEMDQSYINETPLFRSETPGAPILKVAYTPESGVPGEPTTRIEHYGGKKDIVYTSNLTTVEGWSLRG